MDNAYQTFLLIQDKEIVVNAHRWPVVVFRVLPLLVVKLGGSINLILLAFSFSYTFIQLVLYGVIRFYNKDIYRSWLLLALMILPVAHSFYWCNSELNIGLSLVVLWVSCIEMKRPWLSLSILLILPWIHPLLAIMVGIIGGYYFFFNSDNRILVTAHGFLYAAITIGKSLFFPNWYDAEKNKILLRQLQQYTLSDHNLAYILQWAYWPIVLSMIAGIIACIYFKKHGRLLYYSVTTFLYILLQDVMIRNYDNIFYHEVSYLVIFLWSAFLIQKLFIEEGELRLPLQNVLSNTKLSIYAIIGVFIFSIAFIRIARQGAFYRDRIEWYQKLILTNDRNIIEYNESEYPMLIMEWGSPFESILISSIDGPSKTLLFAKTPKDFITTDSVFISHFGHIPLNELDETYFNLEYKAYIKQ